MGNRVYNLAKVAHNVFYTVLGLVQWTMVEGAFLYLYRTGRLPFVHATSTTTTLLQTLVLSVLLPPFRDVHFYFAHRLIHLRCLYKYIHSLHHRNSDTEPFSGLAMHPVEHLYYFTCYGPLLVLPLLFGVPLSPFLVYWMGFHLVITPAASHSGYEDHFSADLHHYLHHRYFECNYSAGINFDAYFGTYQDKLKGGDRGNDENEDTKLPPPPPPADRKSNLGGWFEYPAYEAGVYSLVFGSLYAYSTGHVSLSPGVVAGIVAFGPTMWAVLLWLAFAAPKSLSSSWRKLCLTP